MVNIKKTTGGITLPIAIIISAIVLAISLYAVQSNKQQSIEKQQLLQLQQERKADCLNIYKVESDKWNNVRGWRYSESDNLCFIRYKDPSPKSDAKCDELYPIGEWNNEKLTEKAEEQGLSKLPNVDLPQLNIVLYRLNRLCKEGEFEKSF